MTKATARTLLIVLLLALAMLACVGGGGITGVVGAGATNNTSAQATETYGAEQFHLQLTAQAQFSNP